MIPLLLAVVVLEIMVTKIPNSYNYKYDYVKTHGDSIKILAIGHSQLYDGFDAKVFGYNAFNLSNSSQEFIENYYILKQLLDDMPNLQVVIMPLAYPEVSPLGSKYELSERSTYYHEYMQIDYDGKIPLKYRFEGINIPKACSKIYEYYIKHENLIGCDSLGRRDMYDSMKRTWKLEDNKVISKYYTLKQHSNFELRGEQYLRMILNLLKEKKIQLVLVSTPYYNGSLNLLNQQQQSFVDDYTAELVDKEGVMYLNFQYNTDFKDADFFDEAHLSRVGAEKFTKMLKEKLVHF